MRKRVSVLFLVHVAVCCAVQCASAPPMVVTSSATSSDETSRTCESSIGSESLPLSFNKNKFPKVETYSQTHGKEIQSTSAPTVVAYAGLHGIDIQAIERQLNLDRREIPYMHALICSARYTGGNWTYTRSQTIRIYELLQIQSEDGQQYNAVLYNPSYPAEILSNNIGSKWRLAILDDKANIISDIVFTTVLGGHIDGLWDVITTVLTVRNNKIETVVEYSHSGGGGPREMGFIYRLQVDPGNRSLCMESTETYQGDPPYRFE